MTFVRNLDRNFASAFAGYNKLLRVNGRSKIVFEHSATLLSNYSLNSEHRDQFFLKRKLLIHFYLLSMSISA